jgi:hypothetical protein
MEPITTKPMHRKARTSLQVAFASSLGLRLSTIPDTITQKWAYLRATGSGYSQFGLPINPDNLLVGVNYFMPMIRGNCRTVCTELETQNQTR